MGSWVRTRAVCVYVCVYVYVCVCARARAHMAMHVCVCVCGYVGGCVSSRRQEVCVQSPTPNTSFPA